MLAWLVAIFSDLRIVKPNHTKPTIAIITATSTRLSIKPNRPGLMTPGFMPLGFMLTTAVMFLAVMLPNCLSPGPPAGESMPRARPNIAEIAIRATPIVVTRYGYFVFQISINGSHLSATKPVSEY